MVDRRRSDPRPLHCERDRWPGAYTAYSAAQALGVTRNDRVIRRVVTAQDSRLIVPGATIFSRFGQVAASSSAVT